MVTLKKLCHSFLLLLFAHFLSAQSGPASNVLNQETKRFEAMMRADTAALRPMLADELVYVHSNALQESKKEHLLAIGARSLVYEKMEREAAQVRMYGAIALVNGTLKVKGILHGNAFEIRLLYLAVYRKKHKQWQLLHWQSTRLP